MCKLDSNLDWDDCFGFDSDHMRHSPSSHSLLLLTQRTCLGTTMRRGTWLPKVTWIRWKNRTTLWPTQTATCWRTSPASLRCWSASTSPLWRVSGFIFPPLGPFWRLTCDRFRFLVRFDLIFFLSPVQGSWPAPTALETCVMPRSRSPLEPSQPSPPPPLCVSSQHCPLQEENGHRTEHF